MAEKMIAVPESLLTDIGDAIRTKRDIVTPIPVADMPMQIGMISGGLPFPIDKMTSDTLQIPSSTISIIINHDFGELPDLVYIYADIEKYDDIVASCLKGVYIRTHFEPNAPNIAEEGIYNNLYVYKHPTSGNILGGHTMVKIGNATVNTFNCIRGYVEWASSDANGNPINYKWTAIKFK